jgi:hypothetical protein
MATAREYREQRIGSFQDRRRKTIARYFIPSVGLLFAGVVVGWFLATPWVTFLAFGAGVALWLIGELKYRCPVCRRTPIVGEGVAFDPKVCPHCGASLK